MVLTVMGDWMEVPLVGFLLPDQPEALSLANLGGTLDAVHLPGFVLTVDQLSVTVPPLFGRMRVESGGAICGGVDPAYVPVNVSVGGGMRQGLV